jgi:hypothetical protein
MLADIYLANEFQAERSGKKVAQINEIDAEMRKAG